MNRRLGFTLVELLCVIAIIGVMIALLLPAVQAARETARQTQCANHLKQIGQASINYESINRRYANAEYSSANFGHLHRPTWLIAILPQLGEKPLFDRWAFAVGFLNNLNLNWAPDPSLNDVLTTPVATYYCPSRRAPLAYPGGSAGSGLNHAKTDYAINGGATPDENTDPLVRRWPGISVKYYQKHSIENPIPPESIVLIYERLTKVTSKDVKDGLSKTYLVGEKTLPVPHYEGISNDWDIYHCGNQFTCDRIGNHAPRRDLARAPSTGDGFGQFGSAHRTTWNAVFCDGSVHKLSYGISLKTHHALCSRAGGDTPNAGEY